MQTTLSRTGIHAAATATSTAAGPMGRAGAWIAATANRVFDALVRMSENSSELKRIDALKAKSDAELAAMGLRREDIALRVLRYHGL